MHMMSVKEKAIFRAMHTQTRGLLGNKECLFSVLKEGSKVRLEQTKKANTNIDLPNEL